MPPDATTDPASPSEPPGLDRRPIATRERAASRWAAQRLADAGVSPNAISVAGMIAGLAGGGLLALTAQQPELARAAWLAAAFCVQLRLLANMLDGMVAVSTGSTSAVGELYNEVPDRVSDIAIILGLGYAAGSLPWLGWAAAISAVLTAYVRAMGKAAGATNDFCGPMAKPQRMFTVTLAALWCGLTPMAWQQLDAAGTWTVPVIALAIIAAGSLLTTLRRLLRIANQLQRRGG